MPGEKLLDDERRTQDFTGCVGPTAGAPFAVHPGGQLHLPAQESDSAEPLAFAENLSFNP